MICDFGMSRRLGPLALGDSSDPFQLEPGLPFRRKEYTEETARQIDEEVQAVVVKNYERAKKLLSANGQTLVTLAKELTERERMEGSELRQRLEQQWVIPVISPDQR
jgi:cell division protease FtsH